MLSEVFWIAFISTCSGLLIKLCSMAYKSKCKTISCCYCFKLERDVFLEEKEEEMRMNLKKEPSINSQNECL